jgi:hypothetical protein
MGFHASEDIIQDGDLLNNQFLNGDRYYYES